jgi:putative FmdB family regulatory protein
LRTERIVPIYEYRCTKCGHLIEIIQKLSDRPLRKCPACSGRLEKLVSRASFQLKGGGWYAEGYTTSGGKKSPTKTDSSSKSTKKGSSSTESS